MAKCKNCNAFIPLMEKPREGMCKSCASKLLGPTEAELQKQQEAERKQKQAALNQKANAAKEADIEAIILTTEASSNLKIQRRIEVISAEVAFGQNIFKDLFADVRDVVGGRSNTVQKTMRESRRIALRELKREAFLIGANAVVGVDLDYVELSAAGTMVLLVASGTAVVIEDA